MWKIAIYWRKLFYSCMQKDTLFIKSSSSFYFRKTWYAGWPWSCWSSRLLPVLRCSGRASQPPGNKEGTLSCLLPSKFACIDTSFSRDSNQKPFLKWKHFYLYTKNLLNFKKYHLQVENFTIIFSSLAAILSKAALKSKTALLLMHSSSLFHVYVSIAHKELWW